MVAALFVGVATLAGGGWKAALVLFAFFIPSVALSFVGRARKRALVDTGKHGARDAWQVLANGGIAACCALLAIRLGGIWLAAFAGAFSAASADTWSTEIGTLAKGKPRSILTGKPVATGLSGGVSWQGSSAALGGALVVATVAGWTGIAPLLPAFVGGVAGAFADSIAGAVFQALRWCPQCERACETDPHICGTPTTLRRGLSFFDNDVVNALATTVGAVVAGILYAVTPMMR